MNARPNPFQGSRPGMAKNVVTNRTAAIHGKKARPTAAVAARRPRKVLLRARTPGKAPSGQAARHPKAVKAATFTTP